MASVHEVKEVQNGTIANLANETPTTLKLSRYHKWSGNPVDGSFPDTINPGDSAKFTHLNGNEVASKAGLQYNGFTSQGVECAWVLAWNAPANLTPITRNKVYATCGPKSMIDDMTWDQVAMNLEPPGGIIIPRPIPGPVGVDAIIIDQLPDVAALSARFYLN